MNRQISPQPSDQMRQNEWREIGKKILISVGFTLLLGGNLFLTGVIVFAAGFRCMGGDNTHWICSGPFEWGPIISTVSVVIASLLFVIRRRYWLAVVVSVTHLLTTYLMLLSL